MNTKDLKDMALHTTSDPISSGRKSDFYPVLVLGERLDTITEITQKYPEMTLRKPLDRHMNPLADVLEVLNGNKKVARYRYLEQYGWLEEISPNWTVNADYPTAVAATLVANLPSQGLLNVATTMRFGVLLCAYLLGCNIALVKFMLVKIVSELLSREYRDGAIRVEAGRIILVI